MRIIHSSKPIIRAFTALFVIGILTFTTSPRLFAASLSDTLDNPVSGTLTTAGQVVTPAASPITSSTTPSSTSTPVISTPVVQSVTSPLTMTLTPAPTQTDSDATTDTTAAPASGASTRATTPVAQTQSAASNEAGNQAAPSTENTLYSTHRLSPEAANLLYKIAGIAAVIGLALYALTVLPIRGNGQHPKLRLTSKASQS